MSGTFLPGPSELTAELPLLDSALVQELKKHINSELCACVACPRDLKEEVGKGRGMLWKEMRSVQMLAYPHFGLSLCLRFHSQGLPELSRQLHVVAVVVKTGIS